MTSSRVCCCFVLFSLAAMPAASQPATAPAAAAKAAEAEPIVVRVTLNTEDKGDVIAARTADGDFLIKPEELKAFGFKAPEGTLVPVDGEPHMSLRSMSGVSFTFQERELALSITAAPHLLPTRALESGLVTRARGLVPKDTSGFFNYAVSYASGSAGPARKIGFTGEAGLRYRDYLFLADGAKIDTAGGGRKFVRLTTNVTRDDRQTLQRIIAGDFFTSSRDFSTGVNLGGVSVSKRYSLNPYLVQFPTQSITGNVALPSDLEVYLDGQQIRKERIRPGEFELRDILAYGGARSVQLVLRDAFGRVQQFDYTFYFSDRPLQKGLHEHSYNIGAFRRRYGLESNRYGPPAYSMFHRFGASNAVTLGVRAEGTRKLFNAGPTATLVLGPAGLLNLALSGSSIGGSRGRAGLAGYNYQSKYWNLGMSLRRDWGLYASLGDPVVVTNRKYELSAVVGLNLAGRGAISLSHSALTTYSARTASPPTAAQPFAVSPLLNRRVTSLQYTTPLWNGRVSLTASVSHTRDNTGRRNEAYAGLVFLLDKDYTVSGSMRADKDSNSQLLQFTKNQPIGEGLGYVVSADRSDGPSGTSNSLKSTMQYNAPAAVLRGDFGTSRNHGRSSDDYQLSAAGGVAYVGGQVAVGRPVVDSFAIVRVGGLPGVAVSVNGQPMGKTDARGTVFVPTLSPYVDSEVSIAPESIPIEYSVRAVTQKVSPSLRAGALIDFPATKIQAITGKLLLQNGGPAKTLDNHLVRFSAGGKQQTFQTGRGGEFYLENIKPGSYEAVVDLDKGSCAFTLVIPASDETFLELPPVACQPRP